MIKCDNNCPAVCDYCVHYDFNGDENGAYTRDGWCRLREEQRDPEEDCDGFCCKLVGK